MKTIKMLGGLPRAGSTLLMNLLAQNPSIYASPTSGLVDVCYTVRNVWHNLIEHKSNVELATRKLPRVIRGVIQSYYSDIEQDVIIDKSRGWPLLIEVVEQALGQPVKIVVPVRDVRDVLASFEKLWRQSKPQHQLAGEAESPFQFQSIQGRCEYWLRKDQPVGMSIERIVDAARRGLRDRMHFVDYDSLCTKPRTVLNSIYLFWGLPQYPDHDPTHVEQVTQEDDVVHGFGVPLHVIRPQINPQGSQWQTVLGEVGTGYTRISRFWEQL